MQTVKYVFWEEGGGWLGYLQDFPDYWTQGETLDDLKEHLRDLYADLTSGQLTINNNDVTIVGPGADVLSVSGNHASRVLEIDAVQAVLSGLTITGGTGTYAGAKGVGTMTCKTLDGIHTTCTDKLKLKQL